MGGAGISAHDPNAATLGLISIGLLVVLLAQKEFMRLSGGARARAGQRILNIAIAPLVFSFVVIVIAHFTGA